MATRPNQLESDTAQTIKKVLIPAVALVVVLLLVGWLAYFVINRMTGRVVVTGPGEEQGATQQVSDIRSLLDAARRAVGEQRLIAPPGNNALELYLQVLAQDPQNNTAQVALLELMPYATDRTDRLIADRNVDEAARAIALLKRADPNSVIVAQLENRLAATRRTLEQQQAQQALAQQQAQQAQSRPTTPPPQPEPEPIVDVAPTPAPTPAPEPAAPATGRTAATGASRPAPAATPEPTPAPTVASAAPAPSVAERGEPENRNFELIRRVNPQYPQQALRNGIQGWVELEFTITAEGDVTNVRVVNAQPRRAFEREAIRALSQWKFRPRIVNGRPVESNARQRLEFNLSGE